PATKDPQLRTPPPARRRSLMARVVPREQVRHQRLAAFSRARALALAIERTVHRKTIATSIESEAIRVASIAGVHSTSPLRMIQAPAGLADTPKPPPALFSLSPPPPPPPITFAAGITRMPSRSIGSP